MSQDQNPYQKSELKLMKGAESIFHKRGPVGCLMLHGYSTHPYGLAEMAQTIADHGMTVSVPRLAGHGTTPDDMDRTGWEDWLISGEEALLELREHCTHIFMGGHSLGATLAMELALKYPDDYRGLIFAGPMMDMGLVAGLALPVLKRVLRYMPDPPDKYKIPGSDVVLKYGLISTRATHSYCLGLIELQTKVHLIKKPVLIVHSWRDELARPRNAFWLYRHIGSEDKELLWVRHSDHSYLDRRDKAVYLPKIIEFLTRHGP